MRRLHAVRVVADRVLSHLAVHLVARHPALPFRSSSSSSGILGVLGERPVLHLLEVMLLQKLILSTLIDHAIGTVRGLGLRDLSVVRRLLVRMPTLHSGSAATWRGFLRATFAMGIDARLHLSRLCV